jgi:hypothetical protein
LKFSAIYYPFKTAGYEDKTPLVVLTILALFSCDFRKSVQQDMDTGLTTRGDGLP